MHFLWHNACVGCTQLLGPLHSNHAPNPKNYTVFDLLGIDLATALSYIADMLFIEAPKFTELVQSHLNDEEYAALQWLLLERPDVGAIVPVSGGVRKIR